jgi:Ti-type conjugative transfer relaxase TraA
MAIYRLSSKSISRGKGQSAVASAAYRSAEKLKSNLLNKEFDYTRKEKVSYSEVMLPNGSNEKFKDRETLWNEVERIEKRKDAELAKEYQLAIPKELNQEQSIELVKNFVQQQFVDKGLACDVCFHNLDDDNPHVHIMTTTRKLEQDGFSAKKDRSIKDRSYLIELRKSWEISANRYLEIKGFDEQISCKSYKDMGLNIDGISTDLRGKKGQLDTEYQREINSKKLLENPGQILTALTEKQAIFNDRDLDKFLNRHVLDEDRAQILNGIYESKNLVVIEPNAYTSADYLASERGLIKSASELHTKAFGNIKNSIVEDISKEFRLTEQQKDALIYSVHSDSSIKNIEGYAGSGKSYTINAIREAYERSGYKALGLALSGIVADNLSKDAKIEQSATIASFLHNYENGRIDINDKTVMFVDEASLIGVKDYAQILNIVESNNAKIINIGDDNQLQAIQAGGASALIKKYSNSVQLNEIRRQVDSKDRQATLDLSNGNAREALSHYLDKGSIVMHKTKADMSREVVHKEIENIESGKSSIILAQKKTYVKEYNTEIHDQLKRRGLISAEGVKVNGKEFCEGDKFIFLKNDYSLDVRNGMIGRVACVKQNGDMQIELSDKSVNFNAKDYQDFDHGYAVTIHKAQGITVDSAQTFLDKYADRHLALVGMTRHRKDLTLHTYHDALEHTKFGIKNMDELIDVCLKDRAKTTVQKYTDTLEAHLHVKDLQNQELQNRDKEIQRVQNIALAKFEETKEMYINSYEREKELRTEIVKVSKLRDTNEYWRDKTQKYIDEQNNLIKSEKENQKQRELEKQSSLNKSITDTKSIDRGIDKGFEMEL